MAISVTLQDARNAKPKALAVFSKIADVAGVGITSNDGGYGLKINLKSQPHSDVVLPTHIAEVPLIIEIVGTTRKLSS